MLLSLTILHLARVNTLLLPRNKQPLFIHSPVYNFTGAVKLFLFNTLTYFGLDRGFSLREPNGLALLSIIEINKRRDGI